MLRGLPLLLLLAAPASADKSRTMAGPFVSVDAFCKSLGPCDCRHEEFVGKAAQKPVSVAYRCDASPGSDNSHLDRYVAIEQPAGWFTIKTSEYDGTLWCAEHESISKVTPVQIGAEAALAIELETHGHCDGQSEVASAWSTTHLLALGAGKPVAALPVLLTSKLEESADRAYDAKLKPWTRVIRDVALTHAWGKDGSLQLTAKRSKGVDAAELSRLTGKRRIELR